MTGAVPVPSPAHNQRRGELAYPRRGIELVVPSNAELPFTGWGANFNRRGHDYAVRYLPSGLSIECDGKRVGRWDDLPKMVQAVILKTRETHAGAFAGR